MSVEQHAMTKPPFARSWYTRSVTRSGQARSVDTRSGQASNSNCVGTDVSGPLTTDEVLERVSSSQNTPTNRLSQTNTNLRAIPFLTFLKYWKTTKIAIKIKGQGQMWPLLFHM